jgi:hypothetical protein
MLESPISVISIELLTVCEDEAKPVPDIKEAKKLLDEINAAVASYDPVLKEQARDIFLKAAFGTAPKVKTPADLETGTRDGGPGDNPTAFHKLVEKWTPATQAEWELLGAYYLQVILSNKNMERR